MYGVGSVGDRDMTGKRQKKREGAGKDTQTVKEKGRNSERQERRTQRSDHIGYPRVAKPSQMSAGNQHHERENNRARHAASEATERRVGDIRE